MYNDNENGHRRGRPGGRGGNRSGGGSGGGRGRGKRLFNQGDLRLLVLRLIAEKPCHGYEIIKAIEETSLGVYRPSAGVIYPTLAYLEDLSYATVTTPSGGKKVYNISAEGKAFLDSNEQIMADIDARMGGIRRHSDDEQIQQIRRAMDNLKMGLRLRLSREPLEQSDIHRIVDAIDAAAVAIERS
ncbi:MAG: PadR family transcriptional regulator [Spongiibacteraceae bacterium]|nr:PadR family transcriptional regulator [Spongiibacteraceae bacterium]